MKTGIVITKHNKELLNLDHQMDGVEIGAGDFQEGLLRGSEVPLMALTIEAAGLSAAGLIDNLYICVDAKIPYLVIRTQGFLCMDSLKEMLSTCLEAILQTGICVCLENGYILQEGNVFRNGLTSAGELIQILDGLNNSAKVNCFGAALNIGHANLFGANIPQMILELGDRIKIVHANDNDGVKDLHQMPYTFTLGRGALSTDWLRIIRSLAQIHFVGVLFWDVDGLWHTVPSKLKESMLRLIVCVSQEWQKQLTQEERLNQKDKQLIIFGAGNMLGDYMNYWGGKYPPAFVVDNNAAIWGEKRLGISVCDPQKILEIPEEQRTVLVCSIYYEEITKQLLQMGVKSEWYDEAYWRVG